MSMYNKIFTKILDSSVWLEPTPTRIVWITLIAAMDENGFCPFAAVGNVAGRARVTEAEAKKALNVLESPDPESSDQDNEGRRIERVPGGWIVLNAPKYRALVTRVNVQEKTKERVRRFREKKRPRNASITDSNGDVTQGNVPETPSEANAISEKPSRAKERATKDQPTKTALADARHAEFKEAIRVYWKTKNEIDMPWGPAEGKQLSMWLREAPHITLEQFRGFLRNRFRSDVNHGERPCQWIRWITSYGPGPTDRFKNTAGGENGQGKQGAVRESVTAQRLHATRLAIAKEGVKRGWITPPSPTGEDGEAVSESGQRGDDTGDDGGFRTIDGETWTGKS